MRLFTLITGVLVSSTACNGFVPTTRSVTHHQLTPKVEKQEAFTARHPSSFTLLQSTSSSDSSTETASSSPVVEESPEPVAKRLSKLQQALQDFESAGAQDLLSEINSMRTQGVDQATREAFVDDLLAQGPDAPRRFGALWTRLGFATRFSKRAQWASLRRTLDLTTPPPSESEDDDDDKQAVVMDEQRRRRRALLALLRSLASPDTEAVSSSDNSSAPSSSDSTATETQKSSPERRAGRVPAIRSLELKARRENRSSEKFLLSQWFQRLTSKSISPDELTQRRPANLETPNYSVLARPGNNRYEIRRYEPFAVCSVSMTQPRPSNATNMDATISNPELSGASSFGALAGYLFGKNQQETSMAMTTPVLTRDGRGDESSSGGDKLMSFVLPSEYWAEQGLKKAPQPLDGSGVVLERLDGEERAVAMFGGYASKTKVAQQKQQLLQDLARDQDWQVVVTDGDDEPVVSLAQYNDPFTPPWKRLNEVAVAVQPRSSSGD